MASESTDLSDGTAQDVSADTDTGSSSDTPAGLRERLAHSSAGLLWCAADPYTAVDDLAAAISERDDPTIRRVVVENNPKSTISPVFTNVAEAIGIVMGADCHPRYDLSALDLLAPLMHRPVKHVILTCAWWAQVSDLAALVAAARAAGVTVWLLGGGNVPEGHLAWLTLAGRQLSAGEFLAAFADFQPGRASARPTGRTPGLNPASPDRPTATRPGTPTSISGSAPDGSAAWSLIRAVPSSEFVVFLADVRAQMPAAQASVVEATLRDARAVAAAWFAEHPGCRDEDVVEQLHQLWLTSHGWPHYLAVVRGWQIGAFDAGWFLRVDVDQLAGTTRTVPTSASRPRAAWDRLYAWASPAPAVACALVAAGLSSAEAIGVRIRDVTGDGGQVALDRPDGTSEIRDIEEGARQHVCAAITARLAAGAGIDDRLLVTVGGRQPAERWVSNRAKEARESYGLALGAVTISGRSQEGSYWRTRLGISLTALDVTALRSQLSDAEKS